MATKEEIRAQYIEQGDNDNDIDSYDPFFEPGRINYSEGYKTNVAEINQIFLTQVNAFFFSLHNRDRVQHFQAKTIQEAIQSLSLASNKAGTEFLNALDTTLNQYGRDIKYDVTKLAYDTFINSRSPLQKEKIQTHQNKYSHRHDDDDSRIAAESRSRRSDDTTQRSRRDEPDYPDYPDGRDRNWGGTKRKKSKRRRVKSTRRRYRRNRKSTRRHRSKY